MARLRTWRGIRFTGACLTLALLAGSVGLEAQPGDDLGALDAKVSELRQQVLPHRHAAGVTATVHPSFVLRAQSPEEEYARFVEDLRFAQKQLELLGVKSP